MTASAGNVYYLCNRYLWPSSLIEPSQLLQSYWTRNRFAPYKGNDPVFCRQKCVHVPPDGKRLDLGEAFYHCRVVSPLAVLMDQVIAMSQRIVRAVYVRDAKEDAEVAKDKRRKLPPHCIIVIRQYRQYVYHAQWIYSQSYSCGRDCMCPWKLFAWFLDSS